MFKKAFEWFEKTMKLNPTLPTSEVPMPQLRNKGMGNAGIFYDEIRKTKLFGPVFSTEEFAGCEEIIKACHKASWPVSFVAYAFATAYHETAGTMQPIKEYGGSAYFTKLYDVSGRNPTRARQMGNTSVGDGAKYCGRGYVQLTWKNNYQKAKTKLGYDLVRNPDLALQKHIAADVMICGMQEGWFTGKALRHYLPTTGPATYSQFTLARYIINGQDDAALIANYAAKFQKALTLAKWK